MKTKTINITILLVSVVVAGFILFNGEVKLTNNNEPENLNNVTVVDGKQVISIKAKGGYSPRVTAAKAGMPTVLKIATNGTFDCSSAVVIPDLDYQKNLPSSGETVIDIPAQEPRSKIQGLCSMGMYNFVLNFN